MMMRSPTRNDILLPMTATEEVAKNILTVLTDAGGSPLPFEEILEAEMGVYRGYLVLLRKSAIFIKDRFGRLEKGEEFPYDAASDVQTRKSIFGWECTIKLDGRPLRFTRLEESGGTELARRFGRTAPPPVEADTAPPLPPREEDSISEVREKPPPLSKAPPGDPPGPASLFDVPQEVAPARSDLPDEEPTESEGDRVALIRILQEKPPRTPSAEDLCRQIERLGVESLPPERAADRILRFMGKDGNEDTGSHSEEPQLGMIGALSHIVEDLDVPIKFRRLSARYLATFRERRLLNFFVYHSTREKDPSVARAFLQGLSYIGGEAAVRCLLKVFRRGRQPLASIALDVMSETAWVPVIRALAGEIRSHKDPWHVKIARGCARILRLPRSAEGGHDDPERARAGDFNDFWNGRAH
ncbi:MAG: hypothetical protein ACYTFG_18575, partial [Planctomycetota bacterium]